VESGIVGGSIVASLGVYSWFYSLVDVAPALMRILRMLRMMTTFVFLLVQAMTLPLLSNVILVLSISSIMLLRLLVFVL